MSRQLGGVSTPSSHFRDSYELRQILREERSHALLKHKGDHCICWNVKSESPDPQCSVCDGTGYIFTERKIRIVFTIADIQRTRDSGYVFTHAGILESGDAFAIIDPRHNNICTLGDIILFPYNTKETVQTYIIQTISPAYGTKGKIAFLLLKLAKDPKSEDRY